MKNIKNRKVFPAKGYKTVENVDWSQLLDKWPKWSAGDIKDPTVRRVANKIDRALYYENEVDLVDALYELMDTVKAGYDDYVKNLQANAQSMLKILNNSQTPSDKAESETDEVELTTNLTDQEMQMLEIVANDMLGVDDAVPEDAGGLVVLNKLVKEGFVDKSDLYYALTDKGELALNENVETAEEDEPEAEKAEDDDQITQFMNIAEEVDELTTTLLGTLDTFEEKMNSARQIAKSLGKNNIAGSINQALEDFRSAIKTSIDGLTDDYVVPARNDWVDELEAAKPSQKDYETAKTSNLTIADLPNAVENYKNHLYSDLPNPQEDSYDNESDQTYLEDQINNVGDSIQSDLDDLLDIINSVDRTQLTGNMKSWNQKLDDAKGLITELSGLDNKAYDDLLMKTAMEEQTDFVYLVTALEQLEPLVDVFDQ